MKRRHLRLVVSHCEKCRNNGVFYDYIELFKNSIEGLFLTKNEKLYIIKYALTKIYKDYEISTGISDTPYFEKAEQRIYKIIRDKKINYYYNRLKRFQTNRL